MVAWISSEVIPATSQSGNPRMAVQMLQQTLAQRAIEQQKKQSQMLSQNQPTTQTSEKGKMSSLYLYRRRCHSSAKLVCGAMVANLVLES